MFLPMDQRGYLSEVIFHCGPPFDSKVKIFFSSWRSRPLEHGSTHHMEAWTIKLSHVLSFDRIDFAKIGLWHRQGIYIFWMSSLEKSKQTFALQDRILSI